MSHYVIEYVLAQDSDGFASSNVTTKLTVNESQTSTVITNLFPGTIYKFRVAVMNKNGVSQFSETQCGVFQTLGESMTLLLTKTLLLKCSCIIILL